MAKGQIKDFLSATWEDCGQALLESDMAPEAIAQLGEFVVEEGTAFAIGSVVSAIAPRLNGIKLTYQQKRFERNIKAAIEVMNNRIQDIDQKINLLDECLQEKFRGTYVEWFLDNLYSEKQPEKVLYNVNGYINMMENSSTDDIMLIFMETLNQLTILDIDVLKLYSLSPDENFMELCERYGIGFEQLEMIKQKLERNGLLYSKNEDQRDDNIDIIVDYLDKRTKEENKRNGNPLKVKLGKTKKVRRSESYDITRLGRDFLMKITE
jgi:hypothetical protein